LPPSGVPGFGNAPAAAPAPGFGPPPGAAPPAAPVPPPPAPQPVFGLPDPAAAGVAPPPPPGKSAAPFGAPFALPDDPDPFGLTADPAERAGFGWSWEPPEGEPPPAIPGPEGWPAG
jgi:hypothetical protein